MNDLPAQIDNAMCAAEIDAARVCNSTRDAVMLRTARRVLRIVELDRVRLARAIEGDPWIQPEALYDLAARYGVEVPGPFVPGPQDFTECDRCGLHVWATVHQCKGRPITDKAVLRDRARKATTG